MEFLVVNAAFANRAAARGGENGHRRLGRPSPNQSPHCAAAPGPLRESSRRPQRQLIVSVTKRHRLPLVAAPLAGAISGASPSAAAATPLRGPAAPIDPQTIPTETRRTGRGDRVVKSSSRKPGRPSLLAHLVR